MSDYVPMGTITPTGTATALGGYVPAGSSIPGSIVKIYTGGTATPAGWSAVGGELSYVGDEVFAETTVTQINTTHTGDLDGVFDLSGLSAPIALQCYENLITSVTLGSGLYNTIFANDNALTSVSIGTNLDNGGGFFFGANALPEAEVDGVLADCVASGATGGTLDLALGTNAPPSAGGLADKATLEGRGWTVTVSS